MSQLSFCLIPIAEGSSAGYIFLFFVVRDKDFLVTSYQRRLWEESKNSSHEVSRYNFMNYILTEDSLRTPIVDLSFNKIL